MDIQEIKQMRGEVLERLMARRAANGMWRGELSSSAISTAVSVFALHLIDHKLYESNIERGTRWLLATMKADGSWGDTVESPSNMTATLLSYTALHALGKVPELSREYLAKRFGGMAEADIVGGVLDYYGSDLTFSVPILSMCALSGIISDWRRIPPFPFELAVLPQRFFRFLNLPVVSYAIPALIAIGILQLRKRHSTDSVVSKLREPFVKATLKRLIKLQPEDGGFLEAAPLTAFVSMCLSAAGYNHHPVTVRSADFLTATQRGDGAWPIDTDLACWVTSLAAAAIGNDLPDKKGLAETIKANATKSTHPFTGAPAGGWGWTDLSGSVPDADDTSGALVALHSLTDGVYSAEIGSGVKWLMRIQNSDGGVPTFCKGWGKLPFDRSAPDITAHAALAMGLWIPVLPSPLKAKCEKSFERMLSWLERNQSENSWTPLWFGDQNAKDERSPVYGTATLMIYMCGLKSERAMSIASKGLSFLLESQNSDGGWGGQAGAESKVTLTAKAMAAIALTARKKSPCLDRAFAYLSRRLAEGSLYDREPIGLYFARLWYSEEMYNLCYLMTALNKLIEVYEQE